MPPLLPPGPAGRRRALPPCLPARVHAADLDADQRTAVDSVIVTARPNPEDPPVVAAARRRLSETPGAVSVISRESYASREAWPWTTCCATRPASTPRSKWGGDIRISIRGSGIGNANHNRGLLLAQDGVPLNEADGYRRQPDRRPADRPLHRGLSGRQRPALRRGPAGRGDQHGHPHRRGRPGSRTGSGSTAAPSAWSASTSPSPAARRLGRLRRRHQPDQPGLAPAEPAEPPVRLAEPRPRRSARTARCGSIVNGSNINQEIPAP